jgi:hypothetical protein
MRYRILLRCGNICRIVSSFCGYPDRGAQSRDKTFLLHTRARADSVSGPTKPLRSARHLAGRRRRPKKELHACLAHPMCSSVPTAIRSGDTQPRAERVGRPASDVEEEELLGVLAGEGRPQRVVIRCACHLVDSGPSCGPGPAPRRIDRAYSGSRSAALRCADSGPAGNQAPLNQQLCCCALHRGDVFAPFMTGDEPDSFGTDWHRRESKTCHLQCFCALTGLLRRRSDPLMGNQRVRGSKP